MCARGLWELGQLHLETRDCAVAHAMCKLCTVVFVAGTQAALGRVFEVETVARAVQLLGVDQAQLLMYLLKSCNEFLMKNGKRRKGKGGRRPAADPRIDPNIDPKKARRIVANRQEPQKFHSHCHLLEMSPQYHILSCVRSKNSIEIATIDATLQVAMQTADQILLNPTVMCHLKENVLLSQKICSKVKRKAEKRSYKLEDSPW